MRAVTKARARGASPTLGHGDPRSWNHHLCVYTSGAGRRLDSKSDRGGFDSSTACQAATLRIWDASRLSTGRDGFDSRTWRQR